MFEKTPAYLAVGEGEMRKHSEESGGLPHEVKSGLNTGMLVTAHGTGEGRPHGFLHWLHDPLLLPISFSVVRAQLGLFGRCLGPRMMMLV